MKCSFEIPTKHIRQLKEHQDYDFVLAHIWLNDPIYRGSYTSDMVMDNGAYELGEPLELKDCIRIVRAARPKVFISPDWIDDRQRTCKTYKDTDAALDCEVAGVVVGSDISEMLRCFEFYLEQAVEIICIPFRKPRLEFLHKASELKLLNPDRWYHFLGLNSMEELKVIKSYKLPNTSIDTSKPIKAALHGKTIHDDLRGLGKLDHSLELSDEVVQAASFQMDRFREIAQEELTS
jgi:hypothetical protein